ncbi:hypothetical protein OS493_025077 [Desmophyllum pertusum]|uniref:Plastocyanin-like domain-containing protein n=1 Tax=Desmophyllum pertusum TaxID=174260 RepID=A0A9W9YA23_9CNID|nr:hypothetical protein OS493_025077 [Desmophyllum pertusum]
MSLDNDNVDVELFMNMAFPIPIGSSINSRRMIMPSAPLFQDPSAWELVPCTSVCEKKGCRCSNIINLPANKTVQLVMMSDIFGGLQQGTDFGSKGKAHHPMHLHGFSYRVLKIGFPVVDNITGKILGGNEDIACNWREDKTCSHPYWVSGSAPGLNFDNPPLKDTVVVPAMGNGVNFNVSYEDHPTVPRGFPTCRPFDIGHDEFRKNLEGSSKKRLENCGKKVSADEKQENEESWFYLIPAITGIFSAVGVCLQIVLIVLFLILHKRCLYAVDEKKVEMIEMTKM